MCTVRQETTTYKGAVVSLERGRDKAKDGNDKMKVLTESTLSGSIVSQTLEHFDPKVTLVHVDGKENIKNSVNQANKTQTTGGSQPTENSDEEEKPLGDKEFPKEKQDINSATEDTAGAPMMTMVKPPNVNVECRKPVPVNDELLTPQCDENNSQEIHYGLETPVTPEKPQVVQQVGDRFMTVVTAKTDSENSVAPSEADGSTSNNDVHGGCREGVQDSDKVWFGDAVVKESNFSEEERNEEENGKPQEKKEDRAEKQGGLTGEQNTCPNLVNNHLCEKRGCQDKSKREKSENTVNEQMPQRPQDVPNKQTGKKTENNANRQWPISNNRCKKHKPIFNKKAAQRKKRKYKQVAVKVLGPNVINKSSLNQSKINWKLTGSKEASQEQRKVPGNHSKYPTRKWLWVEKDSHGIDIVKWCRQIPSKRQYRRTKKQVPQQINWCFTTLAANFLCQFKPTLLICIFPGVIGSGVNSKSDEISTNSSQDESGNEADAGVHDKKSPEDAEEELAEDTSASSSCNATPSGTRYASTVAVAGSPCSTLEVSDDKATRFTDFINDIATPHAIPELCHPPSFIHPQCDPEQETKRSPVAGAASQSAGGLQRGGNPRHRHGKIIQGTPEMLLDMLKSEDFKSKKGKTGVLINENLVCKNGKYKESPKYGSSGGRFYARQLSSGGFGHVSYCQDSSTQRDFVTKKIHQERFSINEVHLPLEAPHRHILQLLGVIKRGTIVELLLECASAGTWVHLIYPSGKVSPPPVSLQEEVIFYYLKQALEGLHHLHSHGWWHGDIKPSNIGITTNGIVKIIDYGGATKRGLEPGKGITVNYLPPEVCADKRNCSEKMDIWALACSVIFLMNGREVWTDKKDLVKHIAAHGIHIVKYIPKDDRYTWRLKNLVNYMLNPVPHDRWSAMACLEYIHRKEKLTPTCTTVSVAVPSVMPDIQQLLQDQTEKPDALCKDTTSGYQTQPPRREGELREIETRGRNGEEEHKEEDELGSQEEFYPGHISIDM